MITIQFVLKLERLTQIIANSIVINNNLHIGENVAHKTQLVYVRQYINQYVVLIIKHMVTNVNLIVKVYLSNIMDHVDKYQLVFVLLSINQYAVLIIRLIITDVN